MTKNGLFLVSIGFIIIMFSVSRTTGQYDILNLTTGVFCVGLGGYFYFKGARREKMTKEATEKKIEVKR